MLKLSQDQTREEIRMIESHISKLSDLDIVEIQKGQLGRLVYFAKRGIAVPPIRSKASSYQAAAGNFNDSGPPGPNDYTPAE